MIACTRRNFLKAVGFGAVASIPPAHQAYTKDTLPTSFKTSESFEKSPLSGAGKHPDFQVTSCHHFVTTNVDFAYIETE
jgi:hypothetical protein